MPFYKTDTLPTIGERLITYITTYPILIQAQGKVKVFLYVLKAVSTTNLLSSQLDIVRKIWTGLGVAFGIQSEKMNIYLSNMISLATEFNKQSSAKLKGVCDVYPRTYHT